MNSYFGDGIFFVRELIIDKKINIPLNISYGVDKIPNDIFHYLNSDIFPKDASKIKARDEILAYLKQIDFPNNQVYTDTSFNHINPLLKQ